MFGLYRSDEDSDYEITDQDVNKILIVTQTPPAFKKHPQGDRTGDHISRAKMTSNMTKVINDGLFYYEQDLHETLDVSVTISQWTKSQDLVISLGFSKINVSRANKKNIMNI